MKNNTVTWVVLAVLAIGGAYYLGQGSSHISSPENVVQGIPPVDSGTVTNSGSKAQIQPNANTAANDSLFARRQECSQKLSSFKQEIQAEYNQFPPNPFTLTNFVVGYSPSLQTCIGGYAAISTPGGNYVGILSQYSIVNLSTNQALTGLPGEAGSTYAEDSNPSYPSHQYQTYLNELSILTDGEIH